MTRQKKKAGGIFTGGKISEKKELEPSWGKRKKDSGGADYREIGQVGGKRSRKQKGGCQVMVTILKDRGSRKKKGRGRGSGKVERQGRKRARN